MQKNGQINNHTKMNESLRRHIMMQQGQTTPDYIQDGLIFWLDCLDFEQGQVWTDRVMGIDFPMPATGITKNADGSAAFDGNTAVYVNGDIQQTIGNCCVEAVINDKTNRDSYGIFTASSCLCFSYYNYRLLAFPNANQNFNMRDQDELYNVIKSEFICSAGNTSIRLRGDDFHTTRNGQIDAYSPQGIISLGDVGRRSRLWMGDFYCIRYYNRALTMPERLHNLAIDRQRFGIV